MHTGLRLFLFGVLIFSGLFLAECTGVPANVVEPTITQGIVTPIPKPTVSELPPPPAPTAVTVPSGTGGIPAVAPITLTDNGNTITLSVGQTFLLNLGDGYTWDVNVDDPSIVSREVNILVIRGAQGVYKANAPGKANLTATGDPLCRQSTPPCMMPSIEFHVQVIVNPN